jgi:large subunit ribosomal protein L21
MLAIVEINGKQYQVEEGRFVTVDRLPQAPDETLEIGNVLMVIDGEKSVVGAPFIEGAKVRARVLSHERGAKILVYKMRCKKGYRRKNGHRQNYTRVQIEGLDLPGKAAKA